MHEFSIMQSLVNTIASETDLSKYSKVNEINLVIGSLTQVVPEALEFALEAIALEPAEPFAKFAHTKLNIESVPAKSHCSQCNCDFEHDIYNRGCPQCDSLATELIAGKELYIDSIDVV